MRSLVIFLLFFPSCYLYGSDYEFSADWFKRRIPLFKEHIMPKLSDKKKVNYLEVGVYEGRSFFWVLDNLKKGTSCDAYAVDLFIDKNLLGRFTRNLDKSRNKTCVKIKKGFSQNVLPELPRNHFHLIHLDGSHVGKDTLSDLTESLKLLKVGGLVVVDDYSLMSGKLPIELRPELAISTFASLYRDDLKLIAFDRQKDIGNETNEPQPWAIVFQKIENPCRDKNIEFVFPGNIYSQCSNINGQTYYNWTRKSLGERGTETKLSDSDSALIEDYLLSRSKKSFLENPQLPKELLKVISKKR